MNKDAPETWVKVEGDPEKPRIVQSGNEVRIRHTDQAISVSLKETGSVYLAVDCSGSMEGDKLRQAKRGAMDFAKGARKKGYATGLIRFDTMAVHLCESQHNISVLERHLETMVASGSTNMTHAIELAREKLRDRSGIRVIVVVTDGMPDKPQRALRGAGRAKKEGIDIITIGTDDADSAFLGRLASRRGLARVVQRDKLGAGIASTAEMLPRGE